MFVSWYKTRHWAGRLQRRVGLLMRRPDQGPWVLRPGRPCIQNTFVDFIFGLDYINNSSNLVRLFQQVMAPYGLSILLANRDNVEQVTRDIERGWIRPHVYLDLCARPGDSFDQLLQVAAGQGIYTLRKPEHDRWVMKATSQRSLEQAGLPVPPTVILRADEPGRDLTPEERRLVGERCVIKPSFGEGAKGVVLDVRPTREAIAQARDYNRGFDWLVQRMINWCYLDDRPGYLRAYNIFGHRSLLWWDMTDHPYSTLTWADVHRYDLLPCLDLVNRLAELSGLDFFSTEIAIVPGSGAERFRLIDYFNDACDMDPNAGGHGPPWHWCKWVCERFAEFTWRRKHGLGESQGSSVYLGPNEAGAILSDLAASPVESISAA